MGQEKLSDRIKPGPNIHAQLNDRLHEIHQLASSIRTQAERKFRDFRSYKLGQATP